VARYAEEKKVRFIKRQQDCQMSGYTEGENSNDQVKIHKKLERQQKIYW